MEFILKSWSMRIINSKMSLWWFNSFLIEISKFNKVNSSLYITVNLWLEKYLRARRECIVTSKDSNGELFSFMLYKNTIILQI